MSNTIYSVILQVISQDKNKFNYVYQITELSTGIKYIGSRGSKKLPAINDLKKYKSSTTDMLFRYRLKYNLLNYHYEILSYHHTRHDATIEESRLHFLYNVKDNPLYYNLSNQTPTGFDVSGKVTVKDKYGKTLQVSIDDPRYLSGELYSISKNKLHVKDKNGKSYNVDLNDPRYLSGELIPFSTGYITVKDKQNNTMRVQKCDVRYLSGDLIGIKGDWYKINNQIYSYIQIKNIYNIDVRTVRSRCKSNNDKWKDWFII